MARAEPVASRSGSETPHLRILLPAAGGEVTHCAAAELARGLRSMLGGVVRVESSGEIVSPRLLISADCAPAPPRPPALAGDGFALTPGARALAVDAGSERGLLHAAADLQERLGARFPAGCAPQFPPVRPARLFEMAPVKVEPAFTRRALVSDIMFWNYEYPDRLALHLGHDGEFIAWMARRGINAFSYIRHAHDRRARIDELVASYGQHGIDCEYGGHVLQLLLARERFATDPDYFPADAHGVRAARGNLCVSNPGALALVCAGAQEYVSRYPENRLLHVWGADVWSGAWCSCTSCASMAPQVQYMKVVNAIAEGMAPGGPPVAYLAYHDTIEPAPGLRPLPNVWFEWAPRERCYSHPIDDPACATNPRYWHALERYVELFEGRGHVFEYYADAILFGGFGFATPALIARDLRAYHRLGLRSISCLTFGAYSVLAYPVNLLAFTRASRSLELDPPSTLADAAAERHPACGAEMAVAYRAIEEAAQSALTYADVMRPPAAPGTAARLRAAAGAIRRAIQAADHILASLDSALLGAERELWHYGAESAEGLARYLEALEGGGAPGSAARDALSKIERAADRIRSIPLELKGNWGAYDFEWIHRVWLDALRRRLAESRPATEGD